MLFQKCIAKIDLVIVTLKKHASKHWNTQKIKMAGHCDAAAKQVVHQICKLRLLMALKRRRVETMNSEE